MLKTKIKKIRNRKNKLCFLSSHCNFPWHSKNVLPPSVVWVTVDSPSRFSFLLQFFDSSFWIVCGWNFEWFQSSRCINFEGTLYILHEVYRIYNVRVRFWSLLSLNLCFKSMLFRFEYLKSFIITFIWNLIALYSTFFRLKLRWSLKFVAAFCCKGGNWDSFFWLFVLLCIGGTIIESLGDFENCFEPSSWWSWWEDWQS